MLVFLLVGGAVQQLWMAEEWPASGKVELDLPLLIGAPPSCRHNTGSGIISALYSAAAAAAA
jgi:hypothetical protein